MLKILTEKEKLLRKTAKRVAKIDDSIRNLCAAMIQTMIENHGVGLAAPQVGISKQIVIALIDSVPKAFINPEIISHSKKMEICEEGCLSVPGKTVPKNRYKTIKIKYRNLAGHPKIEEFKGLNARILQHEIDHLRGILIIDE